MGARSFALAACRHPRGRRRPPSCSTNFVFKIDRDLARIPYRQITSYSKSITISPGSHTGSYNHALHTTNQQAGAWPYWAVPKQPLFLIIVQVIRSPPLPLGGSRKRADLATWRRMLSPARIQTARRTRIEYQLTSPWPPEEVTLLLLMVDGE